METRKALKDHFAALKAKKTEVDAALAPLRMQQEDLRAQIAPLEARLREVNQRVKVAMGDGALYALDQEIAAVARALGAKSLKAEAA